MRSWRKRLLANRGNVARRDALLQGVKAHGVWWRKRGAGPNRFTRLAMIALVVPAAALNEAGVLGSATSA